MHLPAWARRVARCGHICARILLCCGASPVGEAHLRDYQNGFPPVRSCAHFVNGPASRFWRCFFLHPLQPMPRHRACRAIRPTSLWTLQSFCQHPARRFTAILPTLPWTRLSCCPRLARRFTAIQPTSLWTRLSCCHHPVRRFTAILSTSLWTRLSCCPRPVSWFTAIQPTSL